MARKIGKIAITSFAGFLYWLLIYVVVEVFFQLKISYGGNNLGNALYLVLLVLFGAVLIVVIQEKGYAAVVFTSMIIVVRYTIFFSKLLLDVQQGLARLSRLSLCLSSWDFTLLYALF
jgi:hypothetical protein